MYWGGDPRKHREELGQGGWEWDTDGQRASVSLSGDCCEQEGLGLPEIQWGTYLRIVPLKLGYLSLNSHYSIVAGYSWSINFLAFSTCLSLVTREINKVERLGKPLTCSKMLCSDLQEAEGIQMWHNSFCYKDLPKIWHKIITFSFWLQYEITE